MKGIELTAFASAVALACTACASQSNEMLFSDRISYILDFPETYSLSLPDTVDLGVPGMFSFDIQDSLIIASNSDKEGGWTILTLNGFKPLGQFLKTGNGPEEFLSVPWAASCWPVEKDGDISYFLADMNKRRMFEFRLYESLDKGTPVLKLLEDGFPYPCFNMLWLEESTCFYRVLTEDDHQKRLERFFLKDGESTPADMVECLNSAYLLPSSDFNLLSADMGYSRDNNRIIEVPIALNYINIYSPDGASRKTICIGKKIYTLKWLQGLERAEVPYTFSQLQIYDDFFAVMYLGETEWSYQLGRTEIPHIYCFDYEGNPLADILVDRQVTGFDFDFAGRGLYVNDLITESFWRYDLPEDFTESLIID